MAALYERYETEKHRRGLVDFDDLLLRCIAALREDTAFAAAQRWRFRHLFVDEYQDVNPTQAALLAGWRGDATDLCVVGDPNQAIYSWNGAEPSYLTEFATREPGATVVRLDDNFRSSPQVLAVAASVLAGGGLRAELRAHRADGPLPAIRAYATDRDEARGVARAVRGRKRPGSPWSRLAVLARTNAQMALLEAAFREAGVPFRVRGGGSFLQQPEVRAALDTLTRAGGALAARLADLEVEIRRPDDDDVRTAERRSVLAELVRLGRELLAVDAGATVESFTAWLGTALGSDAGDTRHDAVDLATFHAAKGLEWPVVFVVGLERGLIPIGHAKTDAAIDEERRLLYVAITRAEEELHCSWASERTFGARAVPRQASPWVDDIQAARAALAGGATALDLRARVADERAKLRAANGDRADRRRPNVTVGAGADPEVLVALKAWRSAAARAAGVPAFVIFHDTTLAAIAEARPGDPASLLQLPGLGPVKAQRYGDDLLRVVAEHLAS
jgi:DNA helicase-2/ATP-dependent DNA helicase PcrA